MTRVCIIAGKVIKGLKLSNKEQAIWNRHLALFSNTRRRKRFKELGLKASRKLVRLYPDGVVTDKETLKDLITFGVKLGTFAQEDTWLARYRYLPLTFPTYNYMV